MTKPTLPRSARIKGSRASTRSINTSESRSRTRRTKENSDVLVSAVISTYLLTHLHHVLQHAEYGAEQAGRPSQAANFAQLRKVLCMDARSMKDASAAGMHDEDVGKLYRSKIGPKVA